MGIQIDTIVYVPDEFEPTIIREFQVTEVRKRFEDIVYLCKALQRPFVGYSFIPKHVGSKVFLTLEEAKRAAVAP